MSWGAKRSESGREIVITGEDGKEVVVSYPVANHIQSQIRQIFGEDCITTMDAV